MHEGNARIPKEELEHIDHDDGGEIGRGYGSQEVRRCGAVAQPGSHGGGRNDGDARACCDLRSHD
eukprot:6248462-Prymnesium_polylepis.2